MLTSFRLQVVVAVAAVVVRLQVVVAVVVARRQVVAVVEQVVAAVVEQVAVVVERVVAVQQAFVLLQVVPQAFVGKILQTELCLPLQVAIIFSFHLPPNEFCS
jgi:lysylphosphatidylglycerol synthetase-like protein (DUF2156 family)